MQQNPNQSSVSKARSALELFLHTPPPFYAPPPLYKEATIDSPPDYATSEALARAQTTLPTPRHQPVPAKRAQLQTLTLFPQLMPASAFIDWDDQTGIVAHKGKKKKKGSGGGDNWSDNEENKDGGAAGAGDGSGGADGGNGTGDGAAGGDDGGGDGGGDDNGGDDWGGWATGKSKKKKNKKGKGGADEEDEEEKKKQEEEANNALSWADEAKDTVNDDWGFAPATGKKKKDKNKKKVGLRRFLVVVMY